MSIILSAALQLGRIILLFEQIIVPFEPINTEKIPVGKQWIAQVKWDGVRILTYYDGKDVRLFNRRQNERTMQYPELLEIDRYCSSSSVILDGEVIALYNSKPSFHEVMRRDGVRKAENIRQAVSSISITYMIFDVLYCNGKWVNQLPLYKRHEIMKQIIIQQQDIQLVESFPNPKELYEVIKEHDMEGIVCKDVTSKYTIGGKDKRWQKVKNYKDITAYIGGVSLQNGIVNSVLLGLYDNKRQFWYIGNAGSGRLTDEELRGITKRIKVGRMPYINKPEQNKGVVWVKPEISVKVKFIEWTKNRTLRQPTIQAVVDTETDEYVF